MTISGQKLVIVAVLAALDVANYLWGVDAFGDRNEEIVGVILTLLLAAAAFFNPGVAAGPNPMMRK